MRNIALITTVVVTTTKTYILITYHMLESSTGYLPGLVS